VSDTPKGRFPKSAHLLKHPEFQRVYQQGRRHFSGNMTVFYLRSGEAPGAAEDNSRQPEGGVRVGFTVSKALGGAVDRNRMRRRTREAVRQNLSLLQGMSTGVDVVINPKKSLLRAEFAQLSEEIRRAFTVIRRGCESRCSAGGSKPSGAEKELHSGAEAMRRRESRKQPRSGAEQEAQLGPACRFTPSCSEYAAEAVARHGALRGVLLATWRLLRCHPLGGRGLDPVPEHFAWRRGGSGASAHTPAAHTR
jgi:ribonuclease P protein component/putative membrane protein insertion efficiency factor